jgi:hypothetical protein
MPGKTSTKLLIAGSAACLLAIWMELCLMANSNMRVPHCGESIHLQQPPPKKQAGHPRVHFPLLLF